MSESLVLDACCGSKMFWFDRNHPSVVYLDKRREQHVLRDASSAGGNRTLIIEPDIQADFTQLPFSDGVFAVVVFDPPHLARCGRNGWMAKKYGRLESSWRDDLRRGFRECFRVLRHGGTLIFKWNENDIALSEVLAMAPHAPLISNRGG